MKRSLTVAFLGFVIVGGAASCGGGDESGPGRCSSCGEAYTLEQCQRWGAKAGCKSTELSEEKMCAPGLAGCVFKDCAGGPICSDSGEAFCASCSRNFTQDDCDKLAAKAGCSDAATTGSGGLTKVQACGHDAVGCSFTGCNFSPVCD